MIDQIPEEYTKGLYYGNRFDRIVVPKRYANRIVSHVIANYLPDNQYFTPPLYLAIKGSPGEGKTLQALAACNQRGIMVKYLSASELSGELEAASRDVLKSVYKQAQQLQALGYYICILLDDFHLGNSNIRSDSNHTVNAELLVGYMMNLAEASSQNRIPILLTGNDFSNTYDALLRDGRADIFEWVPTLEEKQSVARSILQPLVSAWESTELDVFIKAYSDRSIAFFAQIKSDLRKRIVYKALERTSRISSESMRFISKSINQNFKQVKVTDLYVLADARIEARRCGGVEVRSGSTE